MGDEVRLDQAINPGTRSEVETEREVRHVGYHGDDALGFNCVVLTGS